MSIEVIKRLLADLGLNNLESQIYILLYCKPNITGYKIATEISKPVANTYKALNQLVKKGLAVFDESENVRLYYAIDINEYIDRLESDLKQKRRSIIKELDKIQVENKHFGNYNLTDETQVYEKAKSLIKKSKEFLLIDCFPAPYKHLAESIMLKEKEQKTEIRLKIYKAEQHICCNSILAFNGDRIIDEWVGNWLIICKDSDEMLIATFCKNSDKLLHALWSTDPFICFIVYNGLVNEFMLIEILNSLHSENKIDKESVERIGINYKSFFDFESNVGNRIMKKFFTKTNIEKDD